VGAGDGGVGATVFSPEGVRILILTGKVIVRLGDEVRSVDEGGVFDSRANP
jgi:hypothetical protein